jgi:NitT/TauT family transport system permease protein
MPSATRSAWRLWLSRLSPWLVIAALLLVWQVTAASGLVDQRYLSRPDLVSSLVWTWIRSGFIVDHMTATLTEVVIGYVAGTIAGMATAFLFFFRPRIAEICDPLVVLLNATPRAILAPFALLLFGIGELSKIMLVILVVFTITLLNLYVGLKEVDRTLVDNARVMGASHGSLTRHVYMPAALVWIVGAMRMSIGQAFTAAIVCELLGATHGLGWIVAAGQSAVKPDWIMAGLFFAAIVVVVVDLLILAPLERRGSHWRVF